MAGDPWTVLTGLIGIIALFVGAGALWRVRHPGPAWVRTCQMVSGLVLLGWSLAAAVAIAHARAMPGPLFAVAVIGFATAAVADTRTRRGDEGAA